ncbi:MAG: long-chain-acyl-CoA synthetase [Steroidobacteraceae bacterium]
MNSAHKAWTRALERTAAIGRHPSVTLPHVIDALADRFGDAPALVSREAGLSYRELAAAVHRYARWGLAQGWTAGDVVCLLMPNCPQYMAIWLGLNRIGVVVALLNTHLAGDLLARSINSVAPRAIIVGAGLIDALRSAEPSVPTEVRRWALGEGPHRFASLELETADVPTHPLTESECRPPSLEDRALYIYTSGTTGLPKPAAVSHFRVMQWSHWFAGLMDIRPTDRMFDCLPMYHSIGGVVATGAPLVAGATVVLRERFSAGEFWSDVTAQRCTLFQYIGELCRYLLHAPAQPDEVSHALRLCCGNGLRPEVWKPFKQRFRIPQILEYYASTEGSFSLYNCEGQPGAIGRIPPFLSHRLPVALVKFDVRTEAPLRDETGRCVPCEPNETGEALGRIRDAAGRPSGRFEGYVDARESQKKVLEDVFAAGDAWFRTGDLMRQDAQGFYYFVDRVGDTFRWKGENVSTSEVAAVIASCAGVSEVAVYGVRIAGADGRAGMAALATDSAFDLPILHSHLAAHLPEYARPLFVRIVPAIELTGTLRPRKQDFIDQGFEPAAMADAVYFDDRDKREFVRLDAALFERIRAGQERI